MFVLTKINLINLIQIEFCSDRQYFIVLIIYTFDYTIQIYYLNTVIVIVIITESRVYILLTTIFK
jgi:hypothetical protein